MHSTTDCSQSAPTATQKVQPNYEL